jgi:hypothetical protein
MCTEEALDEPAGTWYHGSPLQLTVLRSGSTITPERQLACAFSHKPTILCVADDGRIQHNGKTPGLLYRIAEPVAPDDVYPHPRSTMPAGLEWLTKRDLRLELLGPVQATPEEQLTEADIQELRRKMTFDA